MHFMPFSWATTVLVDMDGVISDFDRRTKLLVKQRHPHVRLASPAPAPWPFYIEDAYPEEHRPLVNAITHEPGFFLALPLIQDALLGWQRIIDAGFTPRICSSPLQVPHCAGEKRQWLERIFVPRFGRGVLDTALITREKWRAEGAVLIEDRPPPMHGSERATWEHVVFDQPCNRLPSSRGYIRLNGWRDPHLASKLAEATDRAVRRHNRK